jgi:hypothetical protein
MKHLYFLSLFLLFGCTLNGVQTKPELTYRFGDKVAVVNGFYKGHCRGNITGYFSWGDHVNYNVYLKCESVDGSFVYLKDMQFSQEDLVPDSSN